MMIRKLPGVPSPMKPSIPPDNRVLPNMPIPMRGLIPKPRLLSGVSRPVKYM